MEKLYYAAACQTSFKCPENISEIGSRTDRMCEIIENTIIGYKPFFDVRLLVFPEFSHAAPIFDTIKKLKNKLSVQIPNEHTDKYIKIAKKHNCYIQSGSFIEYDDNYKDILFNTTLLIGPTGILSKYRKVNPWIPWEIHSSPHDISNYKEELFPVVDTELGKLGVAICYDWLFPETIRQIAFNGAEVIIRVSAYMDPWGATSPMDWWTLFNRTRAVENSVYVVASNQGAKLNDYPPFSWPGSSMIVDYDGRILAQADPGAGEKIVIAPISIPNLREERKRRKGHDMINHLRTECHPYLKKPCFSSIDSHPITFKKNEDRIMNAKIKFHKKHS